MVAQARFRTAELYDQANEGIYDQSMAERSIEAFGVSWNFIRPTPIVKKK